MQKGQAISSTELTVSTQAISIPQGLDAMAVDISGAENLAGYLQPGSHVDIYANITKMSAGGAAGVSATIPIPCTEMAMTNIEVMDVSSTSPTLAGTEGAVIVGGGRYPAHRSGRGDPVARPDAGTDP